MRRCSEVTFDELTANLAFVKVVYNGKTIYDDTTDEGETPYSLYSMRVLYGKKIVCSMKVDIVDFHHCVLTIKGEKDE